MDDPPLVRVLHRQADVDEQLHARAWFEALLIAIVGDGDALDQLHDEERPAAGRRATVQHAGDVRMVHERQRLPFRLEAGHDLACIHPRLDDFQRDLAANRLLLLGDKNQPHAPFTDLLHELVGADDAANPVAAARVTRGQRRRCGPIEPAVVGGVSAQKSLDAAPYLVVASACLIQIRLPRGRSVLLDRGKEYRTDLLRLNRHIRPLTVMSGWPQTSEVSETSEVFG